MTSFLPKLDSIPSLARANWKSGLTVAFISVPLSIALSIASGAGPSAGIITGIWATLIAALFASNNYNVIGAAGALATILFGATLTAPAGIGAAALPLIAIVSGLILLIIAAVGADRYLYYVPGSVMYGFATGVALSIATSELFDATGLSVMKRTGSFLGDITLFASHTAAMHETALITFAVFFSGILLWKRFVKVLPAVIPIAVLGSLFGWMNVRFFHLDLLTLGDRFSGIHGILFSTPDWAAFWQILSSSAGISWLLIIAGTVALVSVLETLVTAKIADRLTHTQSSSRRELFGLALANIGSGVMGGLPATGVFIRTGANIKAGATHRTSAAIAAIATAIIALVVMPAFSFIPMTVIAAILANTALGLVETEQFREYWQHERSSFVIAVAVALITVFKDAGTGVIVGAIGALFLFADAVSHGHFDVVFNYADGSKEERRGDKTLRLPRDTRITVLTYSIAGTLGYIDTERHAANLRCALRSPQVASVIIRLRDLFWIDHEGAQMLAEAVAEANRIGKPIKFSSVSRFIEARLLSQKKIAEQDVTLLFYPKTSLALNDLQAVART